MHKLVGDEVEKAQILVLASTLLGFVYYMRGVNQE